MDVFPFDYAPIPPTTWAYLSSFLMIALFFKFNRFWSVRNLDILLIILLAPGLLMINAGKKWLVENRAEVTSSDTIDADLNEAPEAESNDSIDPDSLSEEKLQPDGFDSDEDLVDDPTVEESDAELANFKKDISTRGHQLQRWGYYWLFSIGAILVFRLLFDPSLKRRPYLEPNLSIGGLVFFGCTLMAFLFANIISARPNIDDLAGAENAVRLVQREAAQDSDAEQLIRRGPGYTLFNLLPIIPSFKSGDEMLNANPNVRVNMSRYVIASKSLAVGSQLLIVLGLILFCYFNYNSFNVGVGTSTIYLMLPYTALYTGHVLHVLPAALLIWAMVSFRRPWIAGILVGLATGVSYYPIFLLPLWASFYWERGKSRFILGVLIAILICIGGLIFTSVDVDAFWNQLQTMFGFWRPIMDGMEGIWALGWNQWWRLPILVAFILLCFSFAAWPLEKNIGTLVSYTGVVFIGVQFWHGFGGGLYMAWYVPMVLLAVFRPNLAGRVAATELFEKKKVQKEKPEDFLPAA